MLLGNVNADVFMYKNDASLLAENTNILQQNLDILYGATKSMVLKINILKLKLVVFDIYNGVNDCKL